jgi:hypothetical protein
MAQKFTTPLSGEERALLASLRHMAAEVDANERLVELARKATSRSTRVGMSYEYRAQLVWEINIKAKEMLVGMVPSVADIAFTYHPMDCTPMFLTGASRRRRLTMDEQAAVLECRAAAAKIFDAMCRPVETFLSAMTAPCRPSLDGLPAKVRRSIEQAYGLLDAVRDEVIEAAVTTRLICVDDRGHELVISGFDHDDAAPAVACLQAVSKAEVEVNDAVKEAFERVELERLTTQRAGLVEKLALFAGRREAAKAFMADINNRVAAVLDSRDLLVY